MGLTALLPPQSYTPLLLLSISTPASTDLKLDHRSKPKPMDPRNMNALTTSDVTSQRLLSADASTQGSNRLEFKRHKPGSIAMNRQNSMLVMISCRAMTEAELGKYGTSGTLFEGHIAPGKQYIKEAQKPFVDDYCHGISDVLNRSTIGSAMIEASAEVEHHLSEHRRLNNPDELPQQKWDYAATQLATVLQAEHLTTGEVSNRESIAQFNGIQPGFLSRLPHRTAREKGYSAEKKTASELVRRIQRNYAAETLDAVTAPDYEPTPTRGHVVFRNPNGVMYWIQKGTDLGPSLQDQMKSNPGTNDSQEISNNVRARRYVRPGTKRRRKMAAESRRVGEETAQMRDPLVTHLEECQDQIDFRFGCDANTQASSQNPAATFRADHNFVPASQAQGSMFQNEPSYPPYNSIDQVWAPNAPIANWPSYSVDQIDPFLEFNQAYVPGSHSLGPQPSEGHSWESSFLDSALGPYFVGEQYSQPGPGNAYQEPQGSLGGDFMPEQCCLPAQGGEGTYQPADHGSVDSYAAQADRAPSSTGVSGRRRPNRTPRLR